MRNVVVGTALAVLSACASAPPVPNMRPMTQPYIEAVGATNVVVSENNEGIGKAWFYTSTSSAGAAYGLIGALVTATMDAIINAGPSKRATKAADEMAELISVDYLNASLADHFGAQIPGAAIAGETAIADQVDEATASGETLSEPAAMVEPSTPSEPPPGIYVSGVGKVQSLTDDGPWPDAINVSASYLLAEDASTLRIIAAVTYENPDTPYVTPYTFESSPPKSETKGPAYRNTFTFYSTQLPVPTLTSQLREDLVQSIQTSYRDENGSLPADGSDDFKAMSKELENARDDKLTKDEIAIFLTRKWLVDDGAMLRSEIDRAHKFIAHYALIDMNRPVTPSIEGQDELLETAADDRSVRRLGKGVEAGSYVSSAGGVSSFSTYGNTIAIAQVNRDRISEVKKSAKGR